MKKLLLVFFYMFSTAFELRAQAIQWAIIQDICPPTSMWGTQGPHINSDGDALISVGRISNSITFGSQTMHGNSGRNSYLAKHGPSGNLVWAKHLVGNLQYLKVTTDSNKNIFLAGTYRDSLHIGTLIFNAPGTTGRFFIAKFDPSGSLVWARNSNFSIAGFTVDPTLTTDGNGNLYVAGGYYNTFSIGSTTLNSLGVDDIFLLKYDTNGNLQWLNSIGTAGAERDASLVGGITNDVYLAYSSRIQGYTSQPGPNGYYLRKFNNAGVQQWSKFVSRRAVYYPPFLSRDGAENIYMAGRIDSILAFDNRVINYTEGTPNNSFLAKISPAGNWKWAKQIQTGQFSESYFSMESQVKNELKIIKCNTAFPSPTYSYNISKLDTSGTILKTTSFANLMFGQPNLLSVTNTATDNFGNTFFSGSAYGNNTLGMIALNAPPAILGPGPPSPSAGFIARILENANTVNGNLFIDANANGLKDTGEKAFENGIVEITPGPGYSSSAANGNYNVFLPAGNFNLQVSQPANHYTFSPQNHSVSFTGLGQNQTKDFALIPIPNRNDVKISVTNITPARPGFELKYLITYENVGTTTLSDSIRLNYTSNYLTFLSATVTPAHLQTGKLQWFYQPLAPTEKRSIEVKFAVANTTPINTSLNAIASIKPFTTDHITENNIDDLQHPVTGSFDPNDKKVNHTEISPAQIANNELLDYVIRFQNTGNDTAFTVVVQDSISNNLQMASFELLSASHSYTFKILENGRVEWRFNNILLPDSTRNEPASHGFIRYRIKPKSSLVLGDEIKSRAAIYFDYNAAVLTNYATTIVTNRLGIISNNANLASFKLYPNPAKNYVMVAAEFKEVKTSKVSLVNMLGQVISETELPANNQIHYQMPLKDLPKGVYIIQLETETGRQMQRLVIQ